MTGLFYAIINIFCGAIIYILGHAVVNRVPFSVFFLIWYLFAGLAFMLTMAFMPHISPLRIAKCNLPMLAFYIFLELSSAVFFFLALKDLTPPVASFIGPSHLFFMFIFSIVFLKERFITKELLPCGFIALGILLVSYSQDPAILRGVLFMIASNITWSLSHVLTKKLVVLENPIAIAFVRTISFIIVGAVYIIVDFKEFSLPNPSTLVILLAGGLLGPFLNIIARYKALLTMDVFKLSLITAQYPILVTLFYYILTGELPLTRKIIGGGIGILGTLLFIKISATSHKQDYSLLKRVN